MNAREGMFPGMPGMPPFAMPPYGMMPGYPGFQNPPEQTTTDEDEPQDDNDSDQTPSPIRKKDQPPSAHGPWAWGSHGRPRRLGLHLGAPPSSRNGPRAPGPGLSPLGPAPPSASDRVERRRSSHR